MKFMGIGKKLFGRGRSFENKKIVIPAKAGTQDIVVTLKVFPGSPTRALGDDAKRRLLRLALCKARNDGIVLN
jgi:hypothetical protein